MLDNVRVAENLQTQMRVDAVVRATAALIGLTLALTGCREHVAVAQVDPNGPVEVVIPERGAYTGAFMDFGDEEDDVTLETIEDFEQMVGKHQAIIASSSYWGEQNFPVDNLNVIWRHGSLPLVFWSPWDKPYEEDRGPDRFSLTERSEEHTSELQSRPHLVCRLLLGKKTNSKGALQSRYIQ